MRFVLHALALNGGDELFRFIDRLVDRAADEVHRIEVPDADLLQSSGWYEGARPTRRKILTSAVAVPPRRHTTDPGPHAKQLEVCDTDSARLADKLAHTPLTILVEDREADGILLEILVEELGSPELRSLWACGQAVTPRAIEFENSTGIGAMPERVNRAVSDAKIEGRPPRYFVLCDSDARWPGDSGPSNRAIAKLRQTCVDASIPLHVLQKRNAENYIPDTVIEAVRDDPNNITNIHRFNALLRRTPVQRDHFPVKDGLSDVERTDAVTTGLYKPHEEADLLLLKERLFPKRPRLLMRLHGERRTDFTGPGFLARDGSGEIGSLLDAIAKEL